MKTQHLHSSLRVGRLTIGNGLGKHSVGHIEHVEHLKVLPEWQVDEPLRVFLIVCIKKKKESTHKFPREVISPYKDNPKNKQTDNAVHILWNLGKSSNALNFPTVGRS